MMRMHSGVWSRAFFFVTLVAFVPREAPAQVQRYAINPGGQYTYLPSPEGPGIPGGMPSAYELDFGVTGFFSIDYGDSTARLLDVDLMLIGNEPVQANPPGLAFVTADRVADWLESRRFIQQPVGAPWSAYTDEVFPLGLTNLLNGTVSLDGGFDSTPADGIGLNFTLNATLIPEPPGWLLACLAMTALALLLRRRRRTNLLEFKL
ncbi:MAG: hypothetical protein WD894_15025 [Pirellulales bacterium]